MEFNYIGDGIDAIVIDNFYTEDQLKEIMLELKWLTKKSIMQPPEKLSSARTESGEILTSKKGIFLEQVFANWQHSALLKYPWDQLHLESVRSKILEFNTLFKILYQCNSRSHLLSYYENSDYYKAHPDSTVFTILNYFHTEPAQFTGGEIKLYSCNSDRFAKVDVKQNRIVIIAGCTMHEVAPIKSKLENTLSGNGRYCNAMFLSVRDEPPKGKKNDSN